MDLPKKYNQNVNEAAIVSDGTNIINVPIADWVKTLSEGLPDFSKLPKTRKVLKTEYFNSKKEA